MHTGRQTQLRMWLLTIALAALAIFAIAIVQAEAAIIYDVGGTTIPTLTDDGGRNFDGTMTVDGGSTLVSLSYSLDGTPQPPLAFSLGANLLALPPLPQDVRQWFDFDDRALLQSIDYDTGAGLEFRDDIFAEGSEAGWDVLTLSTFDLDGLPFTASLTPVTVHAVSEPRSAVLALLGLVGFGLARKTGRFIPKSNRRSAPPPLSLT